MIYWPTSEAEQQFLLTWAMDRVGCRSILYPRVCAVRSDGQLQAVCVFHEYRKTDIQLTFAADSAKWATRSHILELLSYPFVALNVRRITALTDKSNHRARRMLEFAQFKLEGVLRDASDKGSMCLYGMTRADFARLSRKYEQAKRTAETDSGAGAAKRNTGAAH